MQQTPIIIRNMGSKFNRHYRGGKFEQKKSGFTLIEILIVIGIIAVLASVVLVAVNPTRQFKLARDSQRVSNVNSILNTIGQNMAEHRGIFTCNGTTTPSIPTSSTTITSTGGFNLAPCVVPAYISSLPFDPSNSNAGYTSTSSYDTAYSISQDSDGRITVSAVGEITPYISVTR